MKKLPPQANGLAELTLEEVRTRKTKLNEIRNRPKLVDEVTGEELEWSIHWITAQWNWDNPTTPMNGDTVEYCLAHQDEVV